MNIIELNLDQGYQLSDYVCGIDYNQQNRIEIAHFIKPTDKFEEIVKNKDIYDSTIKNSIEFNKNNFDDDDYLHELEENAISYEEFINNPYEIHLIGNKETVIKYIKDNNLENIDKNVVMFFMDEQINMDSIETMESLMHIFKDNNNICINAIGNFKAPKIKDYYSTILLVNNTVNEIENLDLSPLETLMYLYDKVRDRYYILENENEDSRSSRDLTETMLGKNIVCEGFATIFDTIADKLGFVSRKASLNQTNSDIGHVRNIVYVEDVKYDYKGFLFFDPTWDCKKKDDNSHFDRYAYFGLTFNEITPFDYRYNLESEYLPVATASKKLFKEGKSYLDLSREERRIINKLYNMIHHEYIGTFMQIMFESNQLKMIVSDKENKQLTKKCGDIIDLFTNQLYLRQFIDILYTVRKNEYYIDSKKYPLSKEKIVEIVNNSKVTNKQSTEAILLNAIFGKDILSTEQIIEKEKIDKDINRVKVAKTLRKVLDTKTQK